MHDSKVCEIMQNRVLIYDLRGNRYHAPEFSVILHQIAVEGV